VGVWPEMAVWRRGVGEWRRLCSTAAAAGADGCLAAEGASEQQATKRRRARGYWQDASNQRRFLEELAEAHGVREPADWRKVKAKQVQAAGGRGLLRLHGSLMAALQSNFPELDLQEEECRPQRPRGYWAVPGNRRAFLEEVAVSCSASTAGHWRARVTRAHICSLGGRALLDRYPSLFAMLADNLPELDWASVDWRTTRAAKALPRGHWDSAERRLEFLQGFAAARGIRTAADWKKVTLDQLVEAGGAGLLARYPSVLAALNDILGEDWRPADCRPQAPRRYWQEAENVGRFLRELKVRYRISTAEDWARISREQVIEAGGRTLLDSMRLVDALDFAEPDQRWHDRMAGLEKTSVSATKKSSQRWLRTQLLAIFEDCSPPARNEGANVQ